MRRRRGQRANLFDYLEWRGDIPFSADPFNEVDNLVLSELAYADFEGVVTPWGDPVSVRTVRDRYFRLHTREEVRARRPFIGPAPLLLDPLADSVRYRDMRMAWYCNHVSAEEIAQMAAITLWPGDGTIYAAFRGTDNSLVGWREDCTFSYLAETPGQRMAVEYLNDHFQGGSLPLRVGRHSKGGNFAVYASVLCDEEIRKRIRNVFTNDGPGLASAVTRLPAYRDIAPRILSIIPENSLVGILMDSAVEHRIVRSANAGPTAHDALSWLVRGNHFLPAEGRSGFSVFFERSVRAWLADLSDEEKRRFVESVFGVLESTGALTLEEMRRTPVRSAFAILKASRALSPDRQKQVRAVLARLAEKGGSVFAQTFGGSAAELRRRLSAWLRGDPQG